MFAAYPQWDALKLSLMIEEANKISVKLRKRTVFSRYSYLVGVTDVNIFVGVQY